MKAFNNLKGVGVKRAYNLLRWSERYTKTDMVYLAKGGFWLSLGQFIASMSSLIIAVAFANLISQDVYGTYKYIMAIAGILMIFTLPGIDTALIKATASGKAYLFKKMLQEKIRWGLIASIISLIISAYYLWHGAIDLSIAMLAIGILMPLSEAFSLYNSVLQGNKKFNISSKYSSLSYLISTVTSVLAVSISGNVAILIITYFTTWLAVRFILTNKTLTSLKPVIENETDTIDLINYGKHLSVMGVIGTVAMNIDKILIFQYLGAAQAAIYTIAIAVPEQFKGLFKNVGALALPKFSESVDANTYKTIWSKILKMGLGLLLISVFYILLAPYLFSIFFPQYMDSIWYSQIFAISIVTISLIIPVSFLQAKGDTRSLYIYNTTTSVVQILLLVIGIYMGSLAWIISTRIISRFFNLILSVLMLKSHGLRYK